MFVKVGQWMSMVPRPTRKPGKCEYIFQSGKVPEHTGKVGILPKILENRDFFKIFFLLFLNVIYLLNRFEYLLKNTGKVRENVVAMMYHIHGSRCTFR